jgi:hypothetical protein
MRDDLATLPTVSGRITDITRLSPQYGGSGTFVGQDNRGNNMTIAGSYFNGAFGLDTATGGPGDRTGVAPISLEAIEQVQVSVAPYDVREGSFVGANVNTVTRSGTNQFSGSLYALPKPIVRRHAGCRAGLQPRHVRRRTPANGPAADHQEQAVLLRELREPERHAAADHVHIKSGRLRSAATHASPRRT